MEYKNHLRRPEIIPIFKGLSESIGKFSDKETGIWYQVTDQIGREAHSLW